MQLILRLMLGVSLLGAGAATAQELPEGTFASTEQGCAKLATKTPAELGEEFDFSVLTKTGVSGYLQRCDFVNVTAHNATSWVATAFCDESGYVYPDLFAIALKEGGTLSVTRMTDVAQQEGYETAAEDASVPADDLDPSEIGRKEDEATADDGAEAEAGGTEPASAESFSAYVLCKSVKP